MSAAWQHDGFTCETGENEELRQLRTVKMYGNVRSKGIAKNRSLWQRSGERQTEFGLELPIHTDSYRLVLFRTYMKHTITLSDFHVPQVPLCVGACVCGRFFALVQIAI